jgi:hypothetical protein
MVLNGFAVNGSLAVKTIDWPRGRIPVSPISLRNVFLKYRRFGLTLYTRSPHFFLSILSIETTL